MEMQECPFCRFTKVDLVIHYDQKQQLHYVICLHCLARGPAGTSTEMAKQNWNKRGLLDSREQIPGQIWHKIADGKE